MCPQYRRPLCRGEKFLSLFKPSSSLLSRNICPNVDLKPGLIIWHKKGVKASVKCLKKAMQTRLERDYMNVFKTNGSSMRGRHLHRHRVITLYFRSWTVYWSRQLPRATLFVLYLPRRGPGYPPSRPYPFFCFRLCLIISKDVYHCPRLVLSCYKYSVPRKKTTFFCLM